MDTQERLEVRRWVRKAIALYESAGKEETLERIGDREGPFIEGKRYIFALDPDGNLLAHPYSKQLVGQNLAGLRDSEGRAFIDKLLTTAKKRGYGYTDYNWQFPDSKEELNKTVFFEQVDGMILCSGFYSVKESPLEAICRCFRYYGPC
ncbi:MAG: cache domain-containing protein [Syntrophobacter sp.]